MLLDVMCYCPCLKSTERNPQISYAQKYTKSIWRYYSTKLILINPSEDFVNGEGSLAIKVFAMNTDSSKT